MFQRGPRSWQDCLGQSQWCDGGCPTWQGGCAADSVTGPLPGRGGDSLGHGGVRPALGWPHSSSPLPASVLWCHAGRGLVGEGAGSRPF